MPTHYVSNEDLSYYGAFAPDQTGAMTYTVESTKNYEIYPISEMGGEINPEDFENFTFMREHILLNTGDWGDLSILWYELVPQYLNGTLPLAELTRNLDNRMAMMQKE